MIEHPFGWWSVLPPVVAIILAIVTKRVLLSLLVGIYAGALVLANGEPIAAFGQMMQEHLWTTLIAPDKLHVFTFTILMGVMVGVINRGAGMKGLVNAVTPLANTRRKGQFVTWLLGLFVFFDDYANTMLLGNTLRPLTDRLRIAREKLAYLVDSTAAPVAGLALISTWVAGEIDYVDTGLQKLGDDHGLKAFDLFIQSIPYRFYVIFALLFVPMVALLGRDFGSMLKAEKRSGDIDPNEAALGKGEVDPTAPDDTTPARWFNAVIPVFVTVGATFYFLYTSGISSVDPADLEGVGWLRRMGAIFGNADSYGSLLWGALAGAATSYFLIIPQRLVPTSDLVRAGGDGALKMIPALAILWLASALSTMTGNGGNDADSGADGQAALVAGVISSETNDVVRITQGMNEQAVPVRSAMGALLGLASDDLTWESSPDSFEESGWTKEALSAALIAGGYEADEVADELELVATQSTAGDDEAAAAAIATSIPYAYSSYRLYTGDYLSSLLGDWLAVAWMPTIVFILSGFVAFATGTSWGTMGIIMPLVIPLVYSSLSSAGGEVSPQDPILLGSIGAVLAGAIFGDHCSPISDTTVLSSQASGCDHVAHVRTQLPYAILVGIIAIVSGTIPIGWGIPVWLVLPVGIGLMLAFLFTFGKRVEDIESA